jgi:hypothetical protein
MLKKIEEQVGAGSWAEAKKSAAFLRYFDKIGIAIDRWTDEHDVHLD